MNESMLTKILAMLDPEQRVEIYKIPESSESPDDRVLILTGEAGRIDRQSLIDDGYEISGLYVNVDGTVVIEVEESDPDDGELTLYDVLRCMYPSEKAVVVYRAGESRPLATIHYGTVSDLIDALCSGEEDDSDVVRSVNVRDIIAGDEVSDEQLITIEVGSRSTYLNINNCVKAGIIYGKVSSPLPFDSCRGVRHECVLGQ